MRTPAIVPTITQRVRLFLAEQGAALRPWTGLQETYDELYALLRRRRSDPEFWRPLKVLLQEVVDSAADSQRRGRRASTEAELLTSWKVDELVDELRDVLPGDANGAWPTRTDFTRTLSTAVLGGFLLLGLAAAGCAGDSNTSGTGGTVGSGGDVAMVSGGSTGAGGGGLGGASGTGSGGAGGLDGAVADSGGGEAAALDGAGPACSQTVAPELDRAIGESTLGESQKGQLCQCFAALSTNWITSLTQLFATATPQEISTMLAGMGTCCHSDGMWTAHGINADPTSTDLQNIKNGTIYKMCTAVVYKGVSFPD